MDEDPKKKKIDVGGGFDTSPFMEVERKETCSVCGNTYQDNIPHDHHH